MDQSNTPQDHQITSGRHISFWMASADAATTQPLREDLQADIVIVGGGLGGLTTAYCLAKAGKEVILLEDGSLGSGETGRTTAHITVALDDRYYNLIRASGLEKTRLQAESHAAAIEFIEKVANEENISCDFERVSGFLFLHPSDDADSLEKERDACLEAGVNINPVAHVPALLQERSGLEFPRQAQFHPMKYLLGLQQAVERYGGRIFTGTHVSEVSKQGVVTSSGFTVTANHIVVATNAPINSRFIMPMKQFPYRTYVIGALVKKDALPRALWWDAGNYDMDSEVAPYHYVRLQRYDDAFDLLIAGGEDHPTGMTFDIDVPEEERYRRLENWTREFFPIEEIAYRWSGQVMEPHDGIGYIGRNPMDADNVYIITGDSGNGMTHCTIGGMLVSDLILDKPNPWEKVYSPARLTLSESGIILKKIFEEIKSQFKLSPEKIENHELYALVPGEGKLVSIDGKTYGVHKSHDGHLYAVSARCTHLGCTVAWNNDEKTWDCPCHGSRFACDGKVINGPANFDLPSHTEILPDNLGKS